MTYLPHQLGQMDGSVDASKNCVPATGAGLIDRATVGTLRVLGSEVRKASGISGRGLTYSECAAAVLKLTTRLGRPVKLEPVYHVSRSAMKDIVTAGSACGVSIDTSVTRYTTRRTNYYVGPHTVHAETYQWHPATGEVCSCEKRTTLAHAEYLVDDPGTTAAGFLWWSADLLYRAAEKRGGGSINLLVAPDTESVKWVAVEAGALRALPRNDSAIVGGFTVGNVLTGGRTENGGSWNRANGTQANGWVHAKDPVSGKWGWSMSRRLKVAA